MDLTSFLCRNINEWCRGQIGHYVKNLTVVNNRVFTAILREFVLDFAINDMLVPWFETVEDFIEFLIRKVRNPETKNYLQHCLDKLISQKKDQNPSLPEGQEVSEKAAEDETDWETLSLSNNIPGETYDEWIDKGKPLCWKKLSLNRSIPEEFILKWLSEGKLLNYYYLCGNYNISEKTILQWIAERRDLDWFALSGNPKISKETLKILIEENNPVSWYQLCMRSDVPEETYLEWEKQGYRLVYENLSANRAISENTISRWIGKGKDVDWFSLSSREDLSYEFFEDHVSKIDWEVFFGSRSY